jgi:hypothetical protein
MIKRFYNWDIICVAINSGLPVDADYLIGALENSPEPPPPTVRKYIADVIRKKGLPKQPGYQLSLEERVFTGLRDKIISIRYKVIREFHEKHQEADDFRKGTPSELAIEDIAEEYGLSAGAVNKIIYRQNVWHPELVVTFLGLQSSK